MLFSVILQGFWNCRIFFFLFSWQNFLYSIQKLFLFLALKTDDVIVIKGYTSTWVVFCFCRHSPITLAPLSVVFSQLHTWRETCCGLVKSSVTRGVKLTCAHKTTPARVHTLTETHRISCHVRLMGKVVHAVSCMQTHASAHGCIHGHLHCWQVVLLHAHLWPTPCFLSLKCTWSHKTHSATYAFAGYNHLHHMQHFCSYLWWLGLSQSGTML